VRLSLLRPSAFIRCRWGPAPRHDRMKRLASRLTWWDTLPHKSISRSMPQKGRGQPWTIVASACTRGKAVASAPHGPASECGHHLTEREAPAWSGPLSVAKTASTGRMVDLSVRIRPLSELDDHSSTPPGSASPLPLRRPPPARPRESGLAPPALRLHADDDAAQASYDGPTFLL
jgi:hypothetical protein